MKKYLLTLGAFASVTAPIVAVVSCGSDNTTTKEKTINKGGHAHGPVITLGELPTNGGSSTTEQGANNPAANSQISSNAQIALSDGSGNYLHVKSFKFNKGSEAYNELLSVMGLDANDIPSGKLVQTQHNVVSGENEAGKKALEALQTAFMAKEETDKDMHVTLEIVNHGSRIDLNLSFSGLDIRPNGLTEEQVNQRKAKLISMRATIIDAILEAHSDDAKATQLLELLQRGKTHSDAPVSTPHVSTEEEVTVSLSSKVGKYEHVRELLFRPDDKAAAELLSALGATDMVSMSTEDADKTVADKFITLLKEELKTAHISASPSFKFEKTLIHIMFSLNDSALHTKADETAEQTATRQAELKAMDQKINDLLITLHSDDAAVQKIIDLLKRGKTASTPAA